MTEDYRLQSSNKISTYDIFVCRLRVVQNRSYIRHQVVTQYNTKPLTHFYCCQSHIFFCLMKLCSWFLRMTISYNVLMLCKLVICFFFDKLPTEKIVLVQKKKKRLIGCMTSHMNNKINVFSLFLPFNPYIL